MAGTGWERDPDAGSHSHLGAADVEGDGEFLGKPLGDVTWLMLVGQVGAEDHELVAAEARGGVGGGSTLWSDALPRREDVPAECPSESLQARNCPDRGQHGQRGLGAVGPSEGHAEMLEQEVRLARSVSSSWRAR